MGSTGIKTHITTTLVFLLATAMFLTSLVVVVFWQRSLIQAKIEKTLALLTNTAFFLQETSSSQQLHMLEFLPRLRHELGASCLKISLNNVSSDFPHQCNGNESALQDKLNQTITTGVARSTIIDTSPGLPFLSKKHLLVVVPVQFQASKGGIAALIPLQDLNEQILQGWEITLVYILVNTIILATIGLFRMIQVVVRPIDHLVHLTDTYQEGSSPFFFNRGSNEFSQLSQALNKMLQRIDNDKQTLKTTVNSLAASNLQLHSTQQKMIQTEKMVAIGRLATGLAHEIGNPIGIVQGYLELLGQPGLPAEEQAQFSSRSLQELERINRLVRQLLDLTRAQNGNTSNSEAHSVITGLIDMLQAQKKFSNLEFQRHLDAANDQVGIAGEALHQVLLNCLLNSIDAVNSANSTKPRHGLIQLSTANIISDTGQPYLEIRIQDNGIGIKDTDRHNLFDPFFTTKEPGKGTGLGLSVSCALIEGRGGQMQITGEENQGATVTILLPLDKLHESLTEPQTGSKKIT